MYNAYFGFKASPFSIAPDPRYLYMTDQHRDALAHLVYGLNSNGGCILLTGEVGTGKTTICRCLLEQIPEKVNVALVLNPKISELELLESICDELKISYPQTDKSIKTFTDRINHFLIEHNANNEHTVLIIDEAQNLSSTVLEQLRLLTNLETEQHKLLQIIILGQPELLDILAKPELRQLAQRITARYHLQPLSREELTAYLNHRLAVAGQNIQIFPRSSINKLYKLSGGIPRLVNIICDRALLGCYVENCLSVEPRILNKAAKEVFGELKKVEKQQAKSKKQVVIFSLVVLVMLAIALLQFKHYAHKKTPADRQTISKKNVLSPSIAETTPTPTAIGPVKVKRLTPATGIATPAGNVTTTVPATTLTSTAVTATDTDTVSQSQLFNSLIEKSTGNSQVMAYQQLFNQWQLNYDRKIATTACKQAAVASLSCLYKQGNLNSLLRYNRPAVLKLLNPSGKSSYATLIQIKQGIVTLIINQTRVHIKTKTLNQHWLGQYTLLWRRPDNYHKAITPGQSGKIIQWLAHSISIINKTDDTPDNDNFYRGKMIQAVKQFQRQQQLTADGVIGPVTIIHLNTALGLQTPVLSQ